MRVVVIGGGVAGLAAAEELLRGGHQVLLFEREAQVGGQLRTIEVAGTRIECFYHHLFLSDTLMTELVHRLGMAQDLQWIASRVGFYANGRIWDFVTPLDLLRFHPLPLPDRLRLGLVSLYLQRQDDWRRFEPSTAEAWLKRWMGKTNYDVVWEPLLSGKFGDAAPEIGMAWFQWKMRLRFGSRRGLHQEYLGYLAGSFGRVWEALGQSVQRAGAGLYTGAVVRGVVTEDEHAVGIEVELPEGPAAAQALQSGLAQQRDGRLFFRGDRIIATVPSTVVMRLAPGLPESYTNMLRGNRYQAVLCLLMVLKQPLSHIYWLNISDRSIPFVAVVEQTNLLGPEYYQGKHLLYLSNYLSQEAPLYQMSPNEVFETYLPHLRKINPQFQRDWVEEWHLFREDTAQPVITPNYSQKIPPLVTPIRGLYMANNTQVYPEDRGQNYSLRIGREVARLAVVSTAPNARA